MSNIDGPSCRARYSSHLRIVLYPCDVTLNVQHDPLEEYSARLEQELRARGTSVSGVEARAILESVIRPIAAPDVITESERDVLTTSTRLTDDDLTPGSLAASDAQVAARQLESAAGLRTSALTTAQVAELLRTNASYVRRLAGQGHLFTAGRRDRSLLFPAWQFVDGGRIPHLRDVLRVLPRDFHPLSVEAFMTDPAEQLDGHSPAEWLAGGGAPDAVVALADDEAWA